MPCPEGSFFVESILCAIAEAISNFNNWFTVCFGTIWLTAFCAVFVTVARVADGPLLMTAMVVNNPTKQMAVRVVRVSPFFLILRNIVSYSFLSLN